MSNSLPDHPHPGHIKKQAKALLRDGKASKPDALRRFTRHHPLFEKGIAAPESLKLQEAQHVVAREYESPCWSKLMSSIAVDTSQQKPDSSGILLFTNGKSAVDLLNESGVPGCKEEWVDVLHTGPVPQTETDQELNRVRARYLSECGWGGFQGIVSRFAARDQLLADPEQFTELQLWFEHDLFDQLLLIQLIDRIGSHPEWIPKTSLYQFETYLGRLAPESLPKACPTPVALTQEHIQEARRCWKAFRSSDSTELPHVVDQLGSCLPYLKSAMIRLLEEIPSKEGGVGRTERQILQAIDAGCTSPQKIFQWSQAQEEAVFMGDGSFYLLLETLLTSENPLVSLKGKKPFLHPSEGGYSDAFRAQHLSLTECGKRVCSTENAEDFYKHPPFWLGGVEIF